MHLPALEMNSTSSRSSRLSLSMSISCAAARVTRYQRRKRRENAIPACAGAIARPFHARDRAGVVISLATAAAACATCSLKVNVFDIGAGGAPPTPLRRVIWIGNRTMAPEWWQPPNPGGTRMNVPRPGSIETGAKLT